MKISMFVSLSAKITYLRGFYLSKYLPVCQTAFPTCHNIFLDHQLFLMCCCNTCYSPDSHNTLLNKEERLIRALFRKGPPMWWQGGHMTDTPFSGHFSAECGCQMTRCFQVSYLSINSH